MTDAPRTRTMPHTFARQGETIKRLTEENKALINWSRRAYMRLNGLMALGVSINPDAHTGQLLADAPPCVAPGPSLAELAADLGVSEAELVWYAAESVRAPEAVKGGDK